MGIIPNHNNKSSAIMYITEQERYDIQKDVCVVNVQSQENG